MIKKLLQFEFSLHFVFMLVVAGFGVHVLFGGYRSVVTSDLVTSTSPRLVG